MREQGIIKYISGHVGLIMKADGSLIPFNAIGIDALQPGDIIEFTVIESQIAGSDSADNKAVNVVFIDRPESEQKEYVRLSKIASEFNISVSSIVEVLTKKGIKVANNPNAKITSDLYDIIKKHFKKSSSSIKFSDPVKATNFFEDLFLKKYLPGTVVETTIAKIIKPSQIVTIFDNGFIGRLSLLNLSWCLPQGETELKKYKVGDRIECVVLEIDFPNKQVILSSKHLKKQLSDSLAWERIERGDEFDAVVVEKFSNTTLLKTKNNLYGILNNSFITDTSTKYRVKVNSKLEHSELFSFVPASLDVSQEDTDIETSFPEINFIEDELLSFNSFKKSILGIYATDDQLAIIKQGFETDDKVFSKEFKTNNTLYIQFELGSGCYESTLKQNAIPYFLDGAVYSSENENKLLDFLSNQSYWFKINVRAESQKTDFSMFNEDVNIFGDVALTKDKKEIKFIIKNFSFGHIHYTSSEAKKRNAKYGSFLFNNKLKIISPYDTVPFDNSQQVFLDYAILKTRCFEIVYHLKTEAGEILKQEGRTLSINDKFLEYQMSLVEEQKEDNVFVEKFVRIDSITQGVAIKIPNNIGDSLEIDEATVVNVRLKEDDNLFKLSDGVLSYNNDDYLITFNKPIRLDLLDKGFYLDKRISIKQFQIQREIIQDFLEKKIKIDHIETLLVKPDRVKTPVLKQVKFKNIDLANSEKEDSNNNQIKAVKKALGNQNIYLIQGPPGTGKTTVIAEIIQQLVEKGEKILVSGQNHVAVDNVLEKLSRFHNLNLLRVGNPDRINIQLLKYTIDNLVDDYKVGFKKFILNQLLIAEEYLKIKKAGLLKDEMKKTLNKFINELLSDYDVLKDVYKQRHFILLDGLSELSLTELKETIEQLKKWIDESNNEYEILLKPLIYNSTDVVFATCIGIKSSDIFNEKNFKFDTVIIDESGKANIAETLVAVELGAKVILVGDQKQLPPYMDSSLIDKSDPDSFPNSLYGSDFLEDEIIHALKSSFFEFIVNRINAGQFPKDNMDILNYQHRMHPNIGKFVSDSFYDGLVKMGRHTHLNRLNMPAPFNKEVVFFDTSNSKHPFEQNDGFSAKNNSEAEIISEIILPKLFENNVNPLQIAIIAPYKSQVANIKNYINKSQFCSIKNIEVSTLDSFQGKEFDIIIFSFTRSADHLNAPYENGKRKYTKVGFLDDARRLNVAFSRAKKKLILIGNSKTLTDYRSHFDGIFNYTELFRKLVTLSKNDEIGNFINIADIYDTIIDKREGEKKNIFSKLEKGQVLEGTVKNITNYGAFIDLGGFDGLIHITNLSWGRVNHPNEILQLYQKIKVIVLNFDDSKKRIELGLKQLLPHPWDSLDPNLKVGDTVTGKVVIISDYGAFIEIEKGVEGLIHVSEMSWSQHLRTAHDFLKVNDEIQAVILILDRNERRMSLGIKQLIPDPWINISSRYPVNSRHEVNVRNFTNFGIFVELEEGVDGLIHISDLSWSKKIKHPAEFTRIGEKIEVIVLEVDTENRRLSLGHKQLEENPWDVFETLFAINSIHKGTIISIHNKGALVLLANDVEGFAPLGHFVKKDGSIAKIHETLDFKVFEFSKKNKSIKVSHNKTYQVNKKKSFNNNEQK